MIKNLFYLILLVFLPLLTACGLGGPPIIEVDDASVLEAKVSQMTAGDLNFSCICDTRSGDTTTAAFMTIRNRGGEADTLLKVETEGAVRVAFSKGSGEQDVTSAKPVETIELTPRSRIEFNQGQYRMLLTGLKGDLIPGQTLSLTLHFEKSGPLTVDAAIAPRH